MVALYSVITAGPEYFLPSRQRSRETIAAAYFFAGEKHWGTVRKTLPGFARPGRAGTPVPTWPEVLPASSLMAI